MIGKLLRDALGQVPEAERVAACDRRVTGCIAALAEFTGETVTGDMDAERTVDLFDAAEELAVDLANVPGYQPVAFALAGFLVGMQASPEVPDAL